MRCITKEMVKEYKIKKLGYDFMGYYCTGNCHLSFHHLVIARKYCGDYGLGTGHFKWNGAILVQETAHDYLHAIQKVDDEIFLRITSEMIDENLRGHLDVDNLKRIRDLLLYFEREHLGDTTATGKELIKLPYIKNRAKEF